MNVNTCKREVNFNWNGWALQNKEMEKMERMRGEHSEWLLPDHIRAGASCYLDWIAPSLYRHRDSEILLELGQGAFQMKFMDTTRAGK